MIEKSETQHGEFAIYRLWCLLDKVSKVIINDLDLGKTFKLIEYSEFQSSPSSNDFVFLDLNSADMVKDLMLFTSNMLIQFIE